MQGKTKMVDNKTTPVTAWAVEVNGKIHPSDVVGTRAFARFIRNSEVEAFPSAKAHVRKVLIVPIEGR